MSRFLQGALPTAGDWTDLIGEVAQEVLKNREQWGWEIRLKRSTKVHPICVKDSKALVDQLIAHMMNEAPYVVSKALDDLESDA